MINERVHAFRMHILEKIGSKQIFGTKFLGWNKIESIFEKGNLFAANTERIKVVIMPSTNDL